MQGEEIKGGGRGKGGGGRRKGEGRRGRGKGEGGREDLLVWVREGITFKEIRVSIASTRSAGV